VSKGSGYVTFKLDAETNAALQDFAQREGFASIHMAARALVTGGLSSFPAWGVQKSEMLSSAQEVKSWVYLELQGALRDVQAKLDLAVANPPDRFVKGKPITDETDAFGD
jgi:hypothetical protein